MSFQHFRLQTIAPQPPPDAVNAPPPLVGPSSLAQALGQHQTDADYIGVQSNGQNSLTGQKKGPYGSGDADDEENMVEFVKGDTHGSKAVPPRFKDHTKLVCARHSRSGRKKYVKKYPDRVRKVPSRKLEGVGCPASISYKTYFDSDEVRACYMSEHSHEIGIANLPFTKRGRKAQAEQEGRARQRSHPAHDSNTSSTSPPAVGVASPSISANAIAGPSNIHQPVMAPHPAPSHPAPTFQSAISMLAPLPQMPPQPPVASSQDRWDRMNVLFGSIREHARTFEYPSPSIAALESVLIRLYLESPVGGLPTAPGAMDGVVGIGVNGMHRADGMAAPGT
ncbi:hypothetical protein B0H21DRAFT_720345 [Amylocystis lapponica]|nr:hypothetical protein B0H21DRAFT_720345 [Amylocystis lapponica]